MTGPMDGTFMFRRDAPLDVLTARAAVDTLGEALIGDPDALVERLAEATHGAVEVHGLASDAAFREALDAEALLFAPRSEGTAGRDLGLHWVGDPPLTRAGDEGAELGPGPVALEVVLEDATRGINRVDSSLPLNALTARYTRPSGDTTTWAVARLYGVSGGRPELLAQSDPIEGDVDPAATFVPLQFNSVGAAPAPITSLTTTLGPKVLVLYQLPNSFAPPTVSTDPAANLGPDFAVPTDARPKSIVRFTVPGGGLNSVPSPLTLVVP